MSGRGNYRRNRRSGRSGDRAGRQGQKEASDVDESSPVIKAFKEFQSLLDQRHDRHERIVKLGRDVTVESKRTIFLLHRVVGNDDRESILAEAEGKLAELRESRWKPIAQELHGQDPYQFLRAYSPGLQEYIEAVSFLHFLKSGHLVKLEEVEQTLKFTIDKEKQADDSRTSTDVTDHSQSENLASNEGMDQQSKTQESGVNAAENTASEETGSSAVTMETTTGPSLNVSIHIPPTEYMLGLADLTGEVMRMAINSVGNGDFELPFQLCKFMRIMHDAFVSFSNINRELSRKMRTLRESLRKVEVTCYTLQVRGSEVPKHMLVDVLCSNAKTEDNMFGSEDQQF